MSLNQSTDFASSEEVLNRLLTGMCGFNHDVPCAYVVERLENAVVYCRILDIDTLKPSDETLTFTLAELAESHSLRCNSLLESSHFREIVTWRRLYPDKWH